MVYEVAPLLAVHETLVAVGEVAVAETPVGAAGGVQVAVTVTGLVMLLGAPRLSVTVSCTL